MIGVASTFARDLFFIRTETDARVTSLVADSLNEPDVLTRVTALGNDLALDPGIGVCGKGGQFVPSGVGQPTLRIGGA